MPVRARPRVPRLRAGPVHLVRRTDCEATDVRDKRTQKIVVIVMALMLALPLVAGAIVSIAGS